MEYDSDTESESGPIAEKVDPTTRVSTTLRDPSPVFPSSDQAFPPIPIVELVRREIQKLRDLDEVSLLEEDASFLSLQASADTLRKFVEYIPSLVSSDDLGEILSVFCALVNTNFLDRLFEYRSLFRRLAVRTTLVPFASTVVTWVDELLAQLSLLIPKLASGFIPPDRESTEIAESIRSQKREDTVRAAIQLPGKWQDLHLVVGSPDSSPAAKRVATSVLFGAYVIEPQLTAVETWPVPNPPRNDLLTSLYSAASRISSEMQTSINVFDFLPERTNAAMLLVLFSVVDYKANLYDDNVTAGHSQLLPKGFGCLLDLIILVIGQRSDSFFPLKELDAPQTILLRWGSTVPWSWSTWADQRIANAEHLRLLTSTWLCHLNDALFPCLKCNDVFRTDLHFWLLRDIPASSLIISQLCQDVVMYIIKLPKSGSFYFWRFYEFLGKLSWALIQYLESHVVKSDLAIDAQISNFTKFILVIYAHLGNSCSDVLVKSLLIEALTLIPADAFSEALRAVILDKPVQFLEILSQVTRTCAKDLSIQEAKADHTQHVDNGKSFLNFFTVVLLQDKSNNTAIQEIGRAFIISVAVLPKFKKTHSRVVGILRNALLMSLCALNVVSAKEVNRVTNEDVWMLAIQSGKSDTVTAGTFAQYVTTTSNIVSDPLLCYEAWDYFVSALVTILDQEVASEEETISPLMISAICSALSKLLSCSDVSTRNRFLSSPWTFSMEKAMREFIANRVAFKPLCWIEFDRRLKHICEFFLKEVAIKVAEIPSMMSSETVFSSSKLSHRLIYYRDDIYSGLLLVCDVDVVERGPS